MFTADTARIADASSHIVSICHQIEQDVQTMNGRLSELQSSWTGAAATQFQSAMGDWNRVQVQLMTSLNQLGQLVQQAGARYQEAEEMATRSFTH